MTNTELLEFYKYMIDKLGIPLHLIQNLQIKSLFNGGELKLPIGGCVNKRMVTRTKHGFKKPKQINILTKWKRF